MHYFIQQALIHNIMLGLVIGLISVPSFLLRRRSFFIWLCVPSLFADLFMFCMSLWGVFTWFNYDFAPEGGGGGEFFVGIYALLSLAGLLIYAGLAGLCIYALAKPQSIRGRIAAPFVAWSLVAVAFWWFQEHRLRQKEEELRQEVILTITDMKGKPIPNQTLTWKVAEFWGGEESGTAISDAGGEVNFTCLMINFLSVYVDNALVLEVHKFDSALPYDPPCYEATASSYGQLCDATGEKASSAEFRVEMRAAWGVARGKVLNFDVPYLEAHDCSIVDWPGPRVEDLVRGNIHAAPDPMLHDPLSSVRAVHYLPDIIWLKKKAAAPYEIQDANWELDALHNDCKRIRAILDEIKKQISKRSPDPYVKPVAEMARVLDIHDAGTNSLQDNFKAIEDVLDADDAALRSALGRPFSRP